jgi:hypothetical protein
MFQLVPCKGFEVSEWETMHLVDPAELAEGYTEELEPERSEEDEAAEWERRERGALRLSADGRRRREESSDEDADFAFDEVDEDEDLDDDEDDYEEDYDDDDYDDDDDDYDDDYEEKGDEEE